MFCATAAVLENTGVSAYFGRAAISGPAGAAATRTVVLEDIDFTPSRLVVTRGTRSGTYRYVCTVHPGMDGSVGIRESRRASGRG